MEIASLAPAPFGCMILADLGAEVLRIDRAGTRSRGVMTPPGILDRGRVAMALDLKDTENLATLRRIVEHSDVFVEGFRPGVAERLGIGPDEFLGFNPRLIYARMTGWGQSGPLAQRAGHDINYIAVAGALEPIGHAGQRPVPPLNLIGDFAGGGMLMALGILAALQERQHSGRGQVVDAAMVDGASLLMTCIHGMRDLGLWTDGRGQNLFDGGAPFYDTYECADGKYVAVGCVEVEFFAEMITKLALDEETLHMQYEPDCWPALRERLATAFGQRTRDDWAEVFADSDGCVVPVLSPGEAPGHPHNQARDAFIKVDGKLQPAPAPRFSRTPADPPQPLSADAADLLKRWGIEYQESGA